MSAQPHHLLFLHELRQRLRDRSIIGVILLCLRPESIPRRLIRNLPALLRPGHTSLGDGRPPRRRIGNHLPYIDVPGTTRRLGRRAAETLSGAFGEGAPLLGGGAGLPPELVERDALAAQLLALRQEALARVALDDQRLVLGAELVPLGVEYLVVRSADDVGESWGLGQRCELRGGLAWGAYSWSIVSMT